MHEIILLTGVRWSFQEGINIQVQFQNFATTRVKLGATLSPVHSNLPLWLHFCPLSDVHAPSLSRGSWEVSNTHPVSASSLFFPLPVVVVALYSKQINPLLEGLSSFTRPKFSPAWAPFHLPPAGHPHLAGVNSTPGRARPFEFSCWGLELAALESQ